MSKYYIPFGFDCGVASTLRQFNLRDEAYLFDWNIITYNGMYDIINNNFIDLFNEEYLVYGNQSYFHKYNNDPNNYKYLMPVFNIKYNILFVHDFIKNDDKNIIHNKYKRRIERFINNISNNNNVILVYENTSKEYMNNIYEQWIPYFDNKNIFLNVCNGLDNSYNINDIKILIEKKYLNENITLCNINEIN
jgi:hypothetical protein